MSKSIVTQPPILQTCRPYLLRAMENLPTSLVRKYKNVFEDFFLFFFFIIFFAGRSNFSDVLSEMENSNKIFLFPFRPSNRNNIPHFM